MSSCIHPTQNNENNQTLISRDFSILFRLSMSQTENSLSTCEASAADRSTAKTEMPLDNY